MWVIMWFCGGGSSFGFRDIPGIDFGTGLADLCEFILGGTNIGRIKTLSSLFGKKNFGSISLKELRYGFVRVSDWYRQSLSVRRALYAVYDSEVLVRSFFYGYYVGDEALWVC